MSCQFMTASGLESLALEMLRKVLYFWTKENVYIWYQYVAYTVYDIDYVI